MRRYIDLLESILKEFELTPDGTDLPPVAVQDERGGRREQRGSYWIKGSKLVSVPKDKYGHADWCMSVYLAPEAFGMTAEQVLQIVKVEDEFTASSIERGLSPNHLGGRVTGENILMDHGWGFIEYDLPSRMSIRASKEHMREVANNVAERFSLLQCDVIVLTVVETMDKKWALDRNHTYRFHSEDYGYGGAFSALMRAVGGKPVPEVSWAYKQVADPSQGIQAQRGGVSHGNAYYRDQYFITYRGEQTGRALRDKGGWVRFPTSALPQGRDTTTNAGEFLTYSKEPFSIPASALQVWNGRQWVPVK